MTKAPRGGIRAVMIAGMAALMLLAPAALAEAGPLKRGSEGPRVAKVQRWLGITPDRIFGPGTRRAVKRFQRRHGLAADGIVGPATMRALRRTAARRSAGGSGSSRRDAVALLQRRLGIAADGIFGPATWAALGVSGQSAVLKRRGGSRGGGGSTVRRVVAAADRIAGKPYRYGGGHARWEDSGYDCSGSVSYALHGAGLLSSPLTSGGFMRYGAPGPGRRITIYASPSHVYMVVDGRRFDTTGRSESGSRWQASDRSSAGYVVRHPPGL